MIFGNIYSECEQHLHPALQKAINFLKETDFNNIKAQKIIIDGDNMYASIMDAKTDYKQNRRPEAHNKYIDIQFSISGGEIMGYGLYDEKLKVTENKLDEKDVIFYDGAINERFATMESGSYMILFPSDVHRPNCCVNETPQAIRKVVVKVKYELLK